jgi:tRNA(Ile)-lysidine synthetase-like protein
MSERRSIPATLTRPSGHAGSACADPLAHLRTDRACRDIVTAWRALTDPRPGGSWGPGRPTLLACSGGADSSALAIALAALAGGKRAALFTVAHIVHDLRPREEALADREAARRLAERLGLGFVSAEITVRGERGNAEALARRERYRALLRLARAHGLEFIATAHHAGDQLETILAALLRGSGVSGLAGMPGSRAMTPSGRVVLVRPMLAASVGTGREIGRETSRRICTLAGWTWNEDRTNDDRSRLRAALRADIVPRLVALRPGAGARAARAGAILRGVADLLADDTDEFLRLAAAEFAPGRERPRTLTWDRAFVQGMPPALIPEALRAAASAIAGEARADERGFAPLAQIARAAHGDGTDPKVFRVGGVAFDVTAHCVRVYEDSPT